MDINTTKSAVNTSPFIDDGSKQNEIGLVHLAKCEYDFAIQNFEEALASNLKTFNPYHPNVATGWNSLGLAWNAKGDYDKAIECYEKALGVVEKRGFEQHAVVIRKSLIDAKAKQKAGK
jgi:tetratricopeptide (TPR) repeat protein